MPPVFSHGDLRLYLLHLLADSPRHGYDIMQAVSERTGGTYTPSAGTIYPRLAKLEDEGLVTKSVDGRKTVYAITDAGRAEVADRADDVETIERGLTDSVRVIADQVRANVREAMRTLRADVAPGAPREPETAESESTTARQELHRAEAAIADFRGRMRSELRTHVARGGELPGSLVDDLVAALDGTASRASAALGAKAGR
ncbi:MAG: PadR family transcriptional regulator [Microbacterium sp.]